MKLLQTDDTKHRIKHRGWGLEVTIEERIENALADLESLLLEGLPIVDALAEAAEPYGIKPSVLERRAAPEGQIDEYVDRVRAAHAHAQAQKAIVKGVEAYLDLPWASRSSPDAAEASLRSVLVDALGREPTEPEMVVANDLKNAGRDARQQVALDRLKMLSIGLPPRLHTD